MTRNRRLSGLILALAVLAVTPAAADTYLVYSEKGIGQSPCDGGACYFQYCIEGEPNCQAAEPGCLWGCGIAPECDVPEGNSYQRHNTTYAGGDPAYVGWGTVPKASASAPVVLQDMRDYGDEIRLFVRVDPPVGTLNTNHNVKVEFECDPDSDGFSAGVSYATRVTDHGWVVDSDWQEIVIDIDSDSFPVALDLSQPDPGSEYGFIVVPIGNNPGDAPPPNSDACLSNVQVWSKVTLENVDGSVVFAEMSIDFIRWHKANTHTGATKVTTDGRQLKVDGKPFVVNGVAYNPIKVGENWQFTWVDRADRYDVDYPKMFDLLGVNAVRVYAPLVTTSMLNKAWAEGLFVIPTFEVESTNLECPQGKRYLGERIGEMVAEWGNHPAILFWLVGNEVNLNLGAADLCTDWYPQLDAMARLAHVAEVGGGVCSVAGTACVRDADCPATEICVLEGACSISSATACTDNADCPASETCILPDDFHPVGTAVAGVADLCNFCSDDLDLPNVDLWGVQFYPGCGYGNGLDAYSANPNCERPLIITETGVDAYHRPTNAPGEERPDLQASCLDTLVEQAHGDLTVRAGGLGVLSGQTMFEWADEWWKAECSTTGTWSTQETCPEFDAPGLPDGKAHEEWWGLVALDADSDAIRNERTALATVGEKWVGPACNVRVDAYDTANGNTTISFDPPAGGAGNTNLYYGPLSAVSSYGYTTAVTGLGTTGSANVTLPCTQDLFWIVAAENVAAEEGCYGTDSAGTERPCFSGNCAVDQVSGWSCWCRP